MRFKDVDWQSEHLKLDDASYTAPSELEIDQLWNLSCDPSISQRMDIQYNFVKIKIFFPWFLAQIVMFKIGYQI